MSLTAPMPRPSKNGSTHDERGGNVDEGVQRRAEALREAAKGASVRAEQAAEKGIRTLIKDGGQISFRLGRVHEIPPPAP